MTASPTFFTPDQPGGPVSDATLAFFAPIATAAAEIAVFVYLDPEWRILGTRYVPSGRVDEVTIPVREIVADALAFGCVAAVMAHNHPSGDPSPTEADYVLTRRLARALEMVEVRLIDHLILAPGGCESFRRRGLL